jgi:choline dehydrogenase-like flavoprotein
MSEQAFDYIIVGGGSAGCVLANRLSKNPHHHVALIEAGGDDDWLWFHIPVGYLFAIGNPRADWMYQTQAIKGLNGRRINYPRGKVLGGSSAINGMLYMRGQKRDYDQWRDLGLPHWGWDDVKPIFMRHEDHFLGRSEHHGEDGEWRVEAPRVKWAVLDDFMQAAIESGIPRTTDFNGGDNEGVDYFQVNQKRGRRWSAARGFLKPIADRPNLTIFKKAMADKILFSERRAYALSLQQDGRSLTLQARKEIILTAGAIGTPNLLERSGIGNAAHLQNLGIDIVHELRGVGENLQDHLQIRPIYKLTNAVTLNTEYQSLTKRLLMGLNYALFRRGPLTMAPSQLCAFTRTSQNFATPNVECHVQPLSLDRFGEPLHDFPAMTVSICNLRPTSRGSIHITSHDMSAHPAIAPNYLDTSEDQKVAIDSLKLVHKIMSAKAMAHYQPQLYRPADAALSDADLLHEAANISSTIFHPVGTAKMGCTDDPLAVTDAQLRVLGVHGLRIADASVMPLITSGNTNSPTLMIAEKAAAMILNP